MNRVTSKKVFYPIVAIIFTTFLSGGCKTLEEQTPFEITSTSPSTFVKLEPSEKYLTDQAIHKQAQPYLNSGKIVSLIIPHHLIAHQEIYKSLASISTNSQQTVVLLVPDHQNAYPKNLVSLDINWKTDYGSIETKSQLLSELEKSAGIIQNQAVIEEHAIRAVLPLVTHLLPDNEVVVMMVGSHLTYDDIEIFTHVLSRTCSECILISSVDFVHNTDSETALSHDETTIDNIKLDQLKWLYFQDNTYFDSPQLIHAAVRYAQLQQATLTFEHRNDSRVITGDQTAPLTSYQVLLFTR